MSVTIDATTNMTVIENCESSPSGWTGITWTQYSGFNREGTYCYGEQVSTATVTGYKTITSANLTGKAIWWWIFAAGQLDTKANGGIGIVVGDGSHRRAYYVGGSDQSKFQIGVWNCFMLDCSNPPATYNQELGSTAPNFAAVTQIGVRFKTLSKSLGGADNCFIDIGRYGYGLIIKGGSSGSPGTFVEIAADDALLTAGKAYGIVREVQTGVYEVQGRLQFEETGTASSYFEDEDSVVVFANNGAGNTLYQFTVAGNATGTNSFKLGEKVGSGDTAVGRNGLTIMSAGPTVTVDLDDSNMNTLNIYGTKFYKLGGITLSTDSSDEVIGCTFDNCGQVVVNQAIIRNSVFSGYTPDGDGALLWNATANVENCSFVANTSSTNDPHGIEHPSAGAFSYTGMKFAGNDYDINNNSSATTEASYSEANRDSSQSLYTGSYLAVSQSFDPSGTGGHTSASFYLKKTLLPTGTLTAKLYSHSGTYGSSSLPNTLLSTSETRTAESLTTDWVLYKFEFWDVQYTFAGSTQYCTALEFTSTSSDSSNYVEVGYDAGAGAGHGGNMARYSVAGGWSAMASDDTCFYVRSGGAVIITADTTSGSNPATYENTGSPEGITVIISSYSFTLTQLKSGSEVRIYNADTDEEIYGEESSGTEVTYSYSYAGDINIYVHILHLNWNFIRMEGLTLSSANQEIPVQQQPDRVYAS